VHGTEKGPFPVNEPDDPTWIEREDGTFGFLLIVRTGRIVTAHIRTLRRGCDMSEYRRILGVSSIQPGLKTAGKLTVIVTAAVYRGLGSELRPCGLTLPRNLPAPGRRHSVYVVLRLSTLLCF
jgi:hypothetical protein